MRFFKIEKLVRNKTLKRAVQKGAIPHATILADDQAFDQALRLKILEEAQEVASSTGREALCGEIADLLEAVSSLARLHKISEQEIGAMRTQKDQERGGFDERIYATYYEVPESAHEMRAYLLASPEKYPEIDPARDGSLNKAQTPEPET
jgi:predicted house-cleaning noncanonical NTP pyrophosphatase (MazG superfamily)